LIRGGGVGHFHAAHYYRDDDALSGIVAEFVVDGLLAEQPALVIATQGHLTGILKRLADRSLDVARLEAERRLFFRDATALLPKIVKDGMPDRARFRSAVIPMLEEACANHENCAIRVYGDLVNVLWTAGNSAAAHRLEVLWNELAHERDIGVLCGYSTGGLYKESAGREYFLREHTHVLTESGEMFAVRR
jgi:MEDS: MEthanogen/methylotroph, DcmR Sensory domain